MKSLLVLSFAVLSLTACRGGYGGGYGGGDYGGGGGFGGALMPQVEKNLISDQSSEEACQNLQEKYGFSAEKAESLIQALRAVSQDEISEEQAFAMVFGVAKADANAALDEASVGNYGPLMKLSAESAQNLKISQFALHRFVEEALR